MPKTPPLCKDCDPDNPRPRNAKYPGPRCHTHWLAERRRRKEAAHENRVMATYGLAAGEYAKILEAQGGMCAICQRAKGISRRLCVDHDHRTGEPRGCLCVKCNDLLGHARDELDFFHRAIIYLLDPPAQKLRNGAH